MQVNPRVFRKKHTPESLILPGKQDVINNIYFFHRPVVYFVFSCIKNCTRLSLILIFHRHTCTFTDDNYINTRYVWGSTHLISFKKNRYNCNGFSQIYFRHKRDVFKKHMIHVIYITKRVVLVFISFGSVRGLLGRVGGGGVSVRVERGNSRTNALLSFHNRVAAITKHENISTSFITKTCVHICQNLSHITVLAVPRENSQTMGLRNIQN